MLPETPAALIVRRAIRAWLAEYADGSRSVVAVALSGGVDSLALTAGTVAAAAQVHALVVDHQLQPGSDHVAEVAATTARMLGCASARVVAVDVGRMGGLEAAARRARYAALEQARDGLPVLLGHTLDDQAETVLLGLSRGSGGRSIRGMAPFDAPWGRPLLGVRRDVTSQLCGDLGLSPHADPHNEMRDFTRVRLRAEVLPLLEDALGGGVAAALARTAEQLRADGELLDTLADELLAQAEDEAGLSVPILGAAPSPLRRRAVRSWLLRSGARRLTARHLWAVDQLLTAWHGQGPVAVGGGSAEARLVVMREHGRLTLGFTPAGATRNNTKGMFRRV